MTSLSADEVQSDFPEFGPDERDSHRKYLMVASTGGHLAQLVRLAPSLGASDESVWVTFRNAQSESLLAGKRVEYIPYIRPRDVRGAVKGAQAVRAILKSEVFDGAVSTGAAVAVSALPMARLSGVPTLYIESVSRVEGPSLTGRILHATRTAELRTQHPSWSGGRWGTHSNVLSAYENYARRATDVPQPRLFITLGTIKGYEFPALVQQLIATGLVNDDTVWQLGETPPPPGLSGHVHQYMESTEFRDHAKRADVVVSHAGVGSLLALLEMGIYPVLAVRRKDRGEHVDDHQAQIAALARHLGIAEALEVPLISSSILQRASSRAVRLVAET